jgi:hypothetical protein
MNTINFGSKQCERIREQLDAYLSNELLVETTGEVAKHLKSCAGCSLELESLMHVREALRNAVAKKLPPEHLGAAIHASIRKTQPSFFPSLPAPRAWAMAVASLAFVILAGVAGQQWLKVRSGRQMITTILTLGVTDHVHCAIRGHHYPDVAYPPGELVKKLGSRYAALLPVVEAKLPGFEILEAHTCYGGTPRMFIHFIARGRGTILSVILTRRQGESLAAGRFLAAAASGGVDLYGTKLESMNVVGFETRDYWGFVVSDLGRDEMVRLTSPLALPLRNALNAETESGALPSKHSLSS